MTDRLSDVPTPMFDLPAFPQEEVDAVWHVQTLLGEIVSLCVSFNAALRLRKFSAREEFAAVQPTKDRQEAATRRIKVAVMAEWGRFSFREAAITLYDFLATLKAVDAYLKNAPTLLAKVDIEKKREARKAFRRVFPHADRVRDTVAHRGDRAHPDEVQRHWPNQTVRWHETVTGGSFTTQYRGERVGFELTDESVEELWKISDLLLEAFFDADLAAQSRRRFERAKQRFEELRAARDGGA